MKRTGTLSLSLSLGSVVLGTLFGLGGCLGEEPGTEPDEGLASVEQGTYLGNLGSALGSPVATGSTTGLTNSLSPSCVSSAAPDASYTWTAPATGNYLFTTAGSAFDTVLEVRLNSTSEVLGCNDDSGGTLQSSVPAVLSAGQSVTVLVDGYNSASGSFRLNIAQTSAIPGSNIHLWLRADAGTPTTGAVGLWSDQSGYGRHARMATAARQPAMAAGALKGKRVVRFGGAQSMNLDVPAQPTTFTVFVVGKNSLASESFSMILGPGGNYPNNQLRWENGSQALFVGTGNGLPVITSSIGNTRVYHELAASYNGSTMRVFRDGGLTGTYGFGTSGPWTLASVGSWYSSYFMVGDLAEVLIYDRALSDSERAAVDAYLRDRFF